MSSAETQGQYNYHNMLVHLCYMIVLLLFVLQMEHCYLYNFSFLRQMWPYLILAILFMPFSFIAPKTFKLVGFPIFWLWAYMIKIIVEGRRAHYIWYLRFYKYIAIIMLTTRAIVHHITLKEVNQNEVGIK